MGNISIQNSRVARVDDIQNNLDEIMEDIRHGKEIVLTEHDRIIAKIIPFSEYAKPLKWPDFAERAVAIFGQSPRTYASDSLMKTRLSND